MIDCSDTEIAAIRSVHPDAIIFICLWHVMQAVLKQSKDSGKLSVQETGLSRADKTAANKKLRNKAVSDFIRLIHSKTEDSFASTWAQILSTYSLYPDWINYLETQWMPKKISWVMCWRKVITLS